MRTSTLPRSLRTTPGRPNPPASVRRQAILLLCALLLGGATAALLLSSEAPLGRSLIFSALQATAVLVCFRWWSTPVYDTFYNCISPLALFESLSFVYIGPGNIFAFLHHNSMYNHNVGADEYYIYVMFPIIIGLLFFDMTYRMTSAALREEPARHPVNSPTGYRFNRAVMIQAAGLFILCNAVLFYVSSKYVLYLNVQVRTSSEFDNILGLSSRAFLVLAVGCWVILIRGTRNIVGRLAVGGLILPILPYLAVYVSRILGVTVVIAAFVAYGFSRRRGASLWMAAAAVGAVICAYLVLTAVKVSFNYDYGVYVSTSSERSARQRASAMLASGVMGDWGKIEKTVLTDIGYRVAALDFPAAIERAYSERGVPFMHGYQSWVALQMSIPRLFWPSKHVEDPEDVIVRHFGLPAFDQLSTPFAAGYADGGWAGVWVGLVALGVGSCIAQRVIWRSRSGVFIYLGGLADLCYVESYVVTYLLFWVRVCLLVAVACAAIRLLSGMQGPGAWVRRAGKRGHLADGVMGHCDRWSAARRAG